MEIKTYKLQRHGDYRGSLVALEEMKDVPFEVKRVYYAFDTKPGVVRGNHAHKSLEQLMVCVKGSLKLTLDDGTDRQSIVLDNPYEGVYISNNMWREMSDFSEDCVMMVFASEYYDENDYIRDYDEFLKFVGKK